jgi:signal transduction histidine kinase
MLTADANTVCVTIEDDGVGFDVARAEQPGQRCGLGLLGIRERASQLGGTVKVESSSVSGTRIEVELPARERPAHGDGASKYELDPVLLTGNTEVGHG